ncbi:unnamed protein product [Brassicogethes aeneus]|uniref:Uncharacterized protein n=1 Tax=Brassicogethes aeneus TaxID=1431903 RepID=A0A9P0AYC7_BRAAE|nr:unnamed protein product [Brassicogethes aeneus]
MASKIILLAAYVAAAQSSGLAYSGHYGNAAGPALSYTGHLGTYSNNLGYAGHLAYSNLGYAGHLGYAAPLSYAKHYTSKTYATPLITKAYTAPIAHTYVAPIVTKAYAAPVVHNAVVKTISEEPTVSEYSTFVKTAPAFEKTLVHHQAPIVQERVKHVLRERVTPVVHERIAAPALTYAAPSW